MSFFPLDTSSASSDHLISQRVTIALVVDRQVQLFLKYAQIQVRTHETRIACGLQL